MTVLSRVAAAIEETVLEVGEEGAPSGILYLACMAHGIDLADYEGIVSRLVAAGRLRRVGHCLYPPT